MAKSQFYYKRFTEYLVLRNYSPRTIKCYCRSVEKYFIFVRANSVNRASAHEYARQYLLHLRYKGLSWSNVNINYSALMLLFRHVLMEEWDYQMIPRPKLPKDLPAILSHQEVERMINGIKNLKHQTIVITLYSTGCRISELLNFKINDIDSEGKIVRVNQGKGSKDRIIHVSQKFLSVLEAYLEKYAPSDYVFEGAGSKGENSKRYSTSSVGKLIKKAAEKVGVTKVVSPHTFRHSYATHNLDFGTNLEYLRQQLGHSSLKTTSKYLHLCRYQNQRIFHPIDQLQIRVMGAVYKSLQKIWKNKNSYNLNRENRLRFANRKLAGKRFALGYPPRKKGDTSIGDAINWEWIVKCAEQSGKAIILVSRDTDFGTHYDNDSFLNDWLLKEFKERISRKRKIIFTDKLSTAFKLVEIPVTSEMITEEKKVINYSNIFQGITDYQEVMKKFKDSLSIPAKNMRTISSLLGTATMDMSALQEKLNSIYYLNSNKDIEEE